MFRSSLRAFDLFTLHHIESVRRSKVEHVHGETHSLRSNFYVNTRWKHELGQVIDRLLCRVRKIDKTLVNTDLELFTRLFVHVWRSKHRVKRASRRQGDRAFDLRAGAFCRFDDLIRRTIEC
jgi:hypothetical protein